MPLQPPLYIRIYDMKMQKKDFKICTQEGWQTKKGTVGYDYPFYVFRLDEQTGNHDWNLSHIASGYSLRRDISLNHAKQLIKELKPFPLFLLPDAESIANQKKRMTKHRLIQIQNIVNQKEMP